MLASCTCADQLAQTQRRMRKGEQQKLAIDIGIALPQPTVGR
ncbi:hypothetical protein C7S15_5941 [Burkholderia cepacia]|nr:hypothetical protein [Burkholderia cepacia]